MTMVQNLHLIKNIRIFSIVSDKMVLLMDVMKK